MKYLKQFGIILAISLLGEVLRFLIPLPIPASIYGIVLMLLALQLKIIPLQNVKAVGDFLVEVMPVMFIPPLVALVDSWELIRPSWVAYVVITVVSTFLVMVVAGRVTQALVRRKQRKEDGAND